MVNVQYAYNGNTTVKPITAHNKNIDSRITYAHNTMRYTKLSTVLLPVICKNASKNFV